MNTRTQALRVLLLESESHLSLAVHQCLHTKSALKIFTLIVVPNLNLALKEIDKGDVDIILVDLDPADDPELLPLARIHDASPHIPIIALLPDDHQTQALAAVQKGAFSYFLASQIREDIFPAFLLRKADRFSANKSMKESEERFRLMIENSSDVILILDEAGVVHYASPSTKSVLEHSPHDLTGKNALDFIHRDDRLNFLAPFEKAFANDSGLPFVQFRIRRPDERWIHMEGRGRIVLEPSGRKVCILNSHDVSHRVKLEEELRAQSLRDELTGLHNRRSFTTVFEQQLKLAQRSRKKGIYLLFIDLDDFKQINDNLGHKEGDQALIGAAQILKTTFRDADIIARLGGDEFVVYLSDDVKEVGVEILKNRLLNGVESWNQSQNRAYRLSMSVGVIHHDLSERRSVETLLSQADDLMYKQKQEKKARKKITAGN